MSDHKASGGTRVGLAVGAGALALVTFVGGYAVGNAGDGGAGGTGMSQGGQPPSGTAGETPPSSSTGTSEGPLLDS
jgi:hypothetical protein